MKNLVKAIPNTLTVMRLGCSFLLWGSTREQMIYIFAFAILSEFLDGFLARVLDARSTFGRILDPIADKFFSLTMITVLILKGNLHLYHVFAIGMRDLTVIAGALSVVAARNYQNMKLMPPLLIGKIATVCQFIYLADVVLFNRAEGATFWITFIVSFISALDYIRAFFKRDLQKNLSLTDEQQGGDVSKNSMITVVLVGLLLGVVIVFLARENQNLSERLEELQKKVEVN